VRLIGGCGDPMPQEGERSAIGRQYLAAEQVDGLNAGRAFVDRIEPVVAPKLFHLEIARITIAAMNLDREIIGDQAEFGRPAFGHRREQR